MRSCQLLFITTAVAITSVYPDVIQAGDWSVRIGNLQRPKSHYYRTQPSYSFRYGPVTSFHNSYGPITSWGNARFTNRPNFNQNSNFNTYGRSIDYRSPADRFKQRNDYLRGYRQGYRDAHRNSGRIKVPGSIR